MCYEKLLHLTPINYHKYSYLSILLFKIKMFTEYTEYGLIDNHLSDIHFQ